MLETLLKSGSLEDARTLLTSGSLNQVGALVYLGSLLILVLSEQMARLLGVERTVFWARSYHLGLSDSFGSLTAIGTLDGTD